LGGIFQELKRRNVFRVAAAYLVAAWLLLQLADILIPMLQLPDWVPRLILLLLLIGFIPTLIVAWAFELTPEGLKRERDVDRSQSITHDTGRRLNRAIIGILVGVIMLMGAERFLVANRTVPETATPATASVVAAAPVEVTKSIAVLPFVDMSQNQDQEWFADGLSEEILNALTRVPDLLVTSRTSAFSYKGTEKDVPTIAQELGVANVLEGSVRQAAGRIRVTAQLIRAADGFHLWSQNYDRESDDVIDVQEDLAVKIATALETTMDPAALANMVKAGTRSVEAYQAYLRGLAGYASANQLGPGNSTLEGYRYFEEARQLDPGFMAAHLRAASFWADAMSPTLWNWGLTDKSPGEALAEFEVRIDQAVANATNPVDRMVAEGTKASLEMRLRESLRLLGAYLEERPLDVQTWGWQAANAYYASDLATFDAALAVLREQGRTSPEAADFYVNNAYIRDPDGGANYGLEQLAARPGNRGIMYQTHRSLLWAGRKEEAAGLLAQFNRLFPQDDALILMHMRQACAEGRRDEVEKQLAELPRSGTRDWFADWSGHLLLGQTQQAEDVLHEVEAFHVPYMLAGWLSYPYFDPRPFPELVAILEREHVDRPAPVAIPFACPPAN